jgi:hypothetical protein
MSQFFNSTVKPALSKMLVELGYAQDQGFVYQHPETEATIFFRNVGGLTDDMSDPETAGGDIVVFCGSLDVDGPLWF